MVMKELLKLNIKKFNSRLKLNITYINAMFYPNKKKMKNYSPIHITMDIDVPKDLLKDNDDVKSRLEKSNSEYIQVSDK